MVSKDNCVGSLVGLAIGDALGATVEFMARGSGPNEVWSWDITKLKGPEKWTYFYLYVILDIYSRCVVGWMLAHRESADLAKKLIQEAFKLHRSASPQVDFGFLAQGWKQSIGWVQQDFVVLNPKTSRSSLNFVRSQLR